MEKKYQVFISSTYLDLIPEREKARDVILSMSHIPVGMEMFNAADEDQWAIIQGTIDKSDYYILIIGKRYGSIIPDGKPDAGMSYTEKEYRYAVSHGIPVLTFIKNDSAVTVDKVEGDPEKTTKLQKLIDEIITTKQVDWFSNPDQLGTKIALALHKQFARKNRPGWVREDPNDVDASLNETALLNQQLRELSDENKRLKDSLEKREPNLSVSLQYEGTVGDPLIIDESTEEILENEDIGKKLPTTETVYRIHVPQKEKLVLPPPIKAEDVPNEYKHLISAKVIESYNAQLPDESAIEEYQQKKYFYDELQHNGQLMNFVLLNDGTSKATDVHVTLEFPQSFILLERVYAEGMSEPKPPIFPENPIVEAKAGRFGSAMRHLSHTITINNPYAKFQNAMWAHTKKGKSPIDINGKTVTFWCEDILHTYAVVFDMLCFIPTEKGCYTISVSVMCEEYLHPVESKLEIIVE